MITACDDVAARPRATAVIAMSLFFKTCYSRFNCVRDIRRRDNSSCPKGQCIYCAKAQRNQEGLTLTCGLLWSRPASFLHIVNSDDSRRLLTYEPERWRSHGD